jgi:UDP-N-acetylmuramoylalanine--D-glutamate ligase
MIQLSNLQNKKVAILGFGVEGQATANYLSSKNIPFAICDKKNKEDFGKAHPDYLNFELNLGDDYLNKLSEFDYIIKTPGISPLIKEIQLAVGNGAQIISQIELFFSVSPTKNIIGVTGTKGKGTTSTLIYEMIKASGSDVYIGGNIGTPAISFVDDLTANSWVILELSSFQLQTLSVSPHISVVLNITSEHLDYHKDTEEYRTSKMNIVKFQTKDDFAVINADYEVPVGFAEQTAAARYFFSRFKEVLGCYVDNDDNIILNIDSVKQKLFHASKLKLRGRHNLENVTAAVVAAYLARVDVEHIIAVLGRFQGLEHRLELVTEVNGVKYYDDSFSTVPETAIAAIDSFTEPIILIAGGSSKNSDFTKFGQEIAASNVKKMILIGDTAQDILKSIPKPHPQISLKMGLISMEEIIEDATKSAEPGDVVLLSPACASFGLFENYKDRGDKFKKAVRSLS